MCLFFRYVILALVLRMKLKINNRLIEIKEARCFKDKFLGLMGRKHFKYGLLFRCNGIHTFLMKETIDVILTDKNYKILYLYKSLKKNRIILPKRDVYYTIELPDNSIGKVAIGEVLNIK